MKNNQKIRGETDIMIKKLRKTFVTVATVSAAIVLMITILAINGVSVYNFYRQTNGMLSFLAETDGDFSLAEPGGTLPDNMEKGPQDAHVQSEDKGSDRFGFDMTAETKYRTRFFIVTLSDDGESSAADMEHIAALTEEDAISLANEASNRASDSGSISTYRYLVSEKDGKTVVVFLDCTESYSGIFANLRISGLVFVILVVAIFVASILLSTKATRPFEESVRKQKRFITDASHEIKTPLAIISANAEVLQLSDSGENEKWIESIRRQTVRMSSLLRSLIELAKFDEGSEPLNTSEFSLTNAVLDTAAEFETSAAAKGMSIEASVSPDVTINGDEGALRHLVAILCDNAVKHGTGGMPIRISLEKKGRGAVFSISNSAQGVSDKQLSHIFDRFYRTDESRSRDSGGYGIGLSIADSIVAAHHGTIKAKCSDEGCGVTVTVTVP